jgi:hypothetical protein
MSIINNKNIHASYSVTGQELKSKNNSNNSIPTTTTKEIFDHNIDNIIKAIKDLGDKFNINDITTLKKLGL